MELYVYYRVPAACRGEAVAAAQAMQQALARKHPGLQARLLQRTDTGAGADVDADLAADLAATASAAGATLTLMETYASPGGLDAGFAATLDAAAAAWSAAVGAGARHTERFAPIG